MGTGRGISGAIAAAVLAWLAGPAGLAAGARPDSAAPAPAAGAVRLTVEVAWSAPPPLPAAPGDEPEPPAPPAEAELDDGRILGVAPAPEDGPPAGLAPEPAGDRRWRLGPAGGGRARVRVEARTDATLVVRAGGRAFAFPLAAVIEAPRRAAGEAGVEVRVERPAWDGLEVSSPTDGTAEPGGLVPLSVGLNLLAPEAAEVPVRLVAELRPMAGPGQSPGAAWRVERSEVVRTSSLPCPTMDLLVPLPPAEGTYVLELRATWDPAGGPAAEAPGRIARLIRRRTQAPAMSASRRVTLAAVAARPEPAGPRPDAGRPVGEVESVDYLRPRGHRAVASGRAPLPAPGRPDWMLPPAALAVEPAGRERRLSLVGRSAPDVSELGPADASGLAWSAVGLKVPRPGRPHRLTLAVSGGSPEALGVALVVPGAGPGGRPRLTLDAAASGPPVVPGGPATTFSWVVWPDAPQPILVVVNRGTAAPVRLASATLAELADVPGPPAGPTPPEGPGRSLGLHLAGPAALDRFGGSAAPGEPADLDMVARARNLADYLAHCGAGAVVLPGSLADRPARRALDGQAHEDGIGPDRLDLALRVLGRRGLAAWVELDPNAPLPGLPSPDDPDALARGLVRLDRRGQADGPAYHPLHPEVRAALRRAVAGAVASRPGGAAAAGVLVRLGPGASLLGAADTGLDDATFARFAAETFDGRAPLSPGLDGPAPARFAARARFLEGAGRTPWLMWRAREVAKLYDELAEAARTAAPGAGLMVATPGLDDGPAGAEARRVALAGLAPAQAWKAVGLDLDLWSTRQDGPVVLRGVSAGDDPLARDLATSAELDARVAARPRRGLIVLGGPAPTPGAGGPGPALTALPLHDGPSGDEPIGHGMAALDPGAVWLDSGAVAGQEERVRRFARVFRALPAPPAEVEADPAGRQAVAVRAAGSGRSTFVTMANDTPYPIRVEAVLAGGAGATVEDLARGVRLNAGSAPGGPRVVLDLEPFGVTALKVGAERIGVAKVVPHPPAAVLAGMKARHDDLSATLARLDRLAADARVGPANPGFEPRTVQLAGAHDAAPPPGWRASGPDSATAELDAAAPRSGRSSLRLDAPEAPAAVVSDPFAPPAGPALNLSAWLKADRPDTQVLVRLEGEAGGAAIARQSEVAVGPDWGGVALRASGLPAEGLEKARVRFELLTPGRLWVDDLAVSGATLTEAERLNARRALAAALQAYRERRYADFARLAGSHWARRADAARLVPGDPAPVLRTGDASDLPPSRTVR